MHWRGQRRQARGKNGTVRLDLEGAEARVKTQGKAEEPAYIRHETDREWKEQRAENKREGADGSVARTGSRANERTVGEKCR